jgi:M6 family metalloprotease-like protein
MNSIKQHCFIWYRKIRLPTVVTLSVLLQMQNSYAVPASPTIHTLTQSNGLTFKAQQWGDEWSNGWETTTGYTILLDKINGVWKYATSQLDGRLTTSKFRVGIDTLPENFPQKLRPKKQTALQKNIPPATVLAIEAVVPPLGTANVPVILINFNDRTTTYTPLNFENLLFGVGNKSMNDYYKEVSYEEFSVSSGPAGVVGWYQALHGHNYYGYNQGFKLARELAEEAVTAADTTVNFADYDSDGDCYVDTVMIIHQGTGTEASGDYNDIWSHAWNITYITNDNASCGAIKISNYTMEPEILQGNIHTVGVFAHEYGHALGLPDLYDTDDSSEGIGNWDLMAGGAWNKVTKLGDTPAHLSAWSKYALGWVVPHLVTAELSNESIEQVATQADVYQFLTGSPLTGGEYFLVENRTRTGFDAGLPTSGLAIWHIDESKASLDNTDNANECVSPDNPAGNCAAKHYRVALIQADNRWDLEKGTNRGNRGDLYSSLLNYTTFNDNSSPSSKLYNGSSSKVCVTGISNSGSVMTATLNNNCSSSPPPTTDSSCMGLQCTLVGTANNDVIYGTTSQDIICGGGGNDRIYGNKGNDTICGGDGNDIIYGEAGDDTLSGEGGSDRCVGGLGTDQIDCETASP